MGPGVQAQGGGGGAVRRRGEAAQLIVAQLTCGLNMPEFGTSLVTFFARLKAANVAIFFGDDWWRALAGHMEG